MTNRLCAAVLRRIGVPVEAADRLCAMDDEILMLGPLSLSLQGGQVFAYDHESDVESDDSDPDFAATIAAYAAALVSSGARWVFLDQDAPLVALAALSVRDRYEVVA